jgi:hypothetical protein
MIGKLVHDSPKLRRSISIFAELGQEEGVTLEAGMRQTDASLVPPILVGKATLEDTIEDTLAAKDLLEDMRELQAGKLKS